MTLPETITPLTLIALGLVAIVMIAQAYLNSQVRVLNERVHDMQSEIATLKGENVLLKQRVSQLEDENAVLSHGKAQVEAQLEAAGIRGVV